MPLFYLLSFGNEKINPAKKPSTTDPIAKTSLPILSGKKFQKHMAATTPSIVPNQTRFGVKSVSRINSIISGLLINIICNFKLNQSLKISKNIIRPYAKPSIVNMTGIAR